MTTLESTAFASPWAETETARPRRTATLTYRVPLDARLVAAQSNEVLGTTLPSRTVAGVPVVLCRDSAARTAAMKDRCPDKNDGLALGRVVHDATECGYHGWWFGVDGRRVAVRCHSPDELPARCRVGGASETSSPTARGVDAAGTSRSGSEGAIPRPSAISHDRVQALGGQR